jgi:hypothetical protein
MTVLAEVVEESINGMETTMVSKAEQEKVRSASRFTFYEISADILAKIYPESRFRPTQIRAPTAREKRSNPDEIRK